MEEIKFFGEAVKSGNRLIRCACNLMCNDKMNKNGVYYPHTYMFTVEEAMVISSEAFDWPVVYKISNNSGDVYSKPTVLHNISDFNIKVESLANEDPDAIIMISKPSRVSSGYSSPNYYTSTDYYLAKDYLLINQRYGNFSFVINTNNSCGFKLAGLDTSFVYRLTQSRLQDGSYKFVIENIFNYDDKRLTEIKKNTYKDIIFDEVIWADFVRGYKAGKSESSKNTFVSRIPNRHINTSYITDGYTFGLILSLKINNILIKPAVSGISDEYDLSTIFCLKKMIGDNTINEMRLAANLHNSIISSDKQKVLGYLKEILSDGKNIKIGKLLYEANKIGWKMWVSKENEHEHSTFDKLFKVPDENDESYFDINLNLKNAQIRIVDSDSKLARIRVQVGEFNVSTVITVKDSEPKEIRSFSLGKFENDVIVRVENLKNFAGPKNIKELIKKFKDMEHTGVSQAGTEQVYVPFEILGENIVELKTGEAIIPKLLLIDYCVKNSLISLPSSN